MKNLIQAAVVTLFAASTAQAQQAVQWKVSDGGNGHWYARVGRTTESWDTLRLVAEQQGGCLASSVSAAENEFLLAIAFPKGATGHVALGGLNPGGACGGPWQWIDGSPFAYANWDETQPDCWEEEIVVLYSSGRWHDYPRTGFFGTWTGALIEWSADCNSDGIVDYGQILNGTFADVNADGIPDVCQAPCVPADLNNDRSVDGADLGMLVSGWGPTGPESAREDINGNGIVDGADLGILLSFWGACP